MTKEKDGMELDKKALEKAIRAGIKAHRVAAPPPGKVLTVPKAQGMAPQQSPAAVLAMAGPEGAAVATALETLKPALQAAYNELKRPLATARLNEDLDVELDEFQITPAGVLTFAGVGLGVWLIWLYLKGKLMWDPFGLGQLNLSPGATTVANYAATVPATGSPFIFALLKAFKVI